MKKLTTDKIYTYIKILGIIGLMLSIYLLWQQMARPAFQPCYINSGINCDAVVKGPVAKTFGISTPLIGFMGYIMILVGAFFKHKKMVLGMSAFGLIFCLYIAFIELFQLRVICPVCIGCQIDMGLTFALAVMLNRRKDKIAS